jgi:hypothetical protein
MCIQLLTFVLVIFKLELTPHSVPSPLALLSEYCWSSNPVHTHYFDDTLLSCYCTDLLLLWATSELISRMDRRLHGTDQHNSIKRRSFIIWY